MPAKNNKPSTIIKITTYIISAYSALFILSVIVMLFDVIIHVDPNSFLMNIWYFSAWFLWWIFIIGIITSLAFKNALSKSNKLHKLARALVILNITAIAAVPVSFIIVLIGFALSCTGSC